MGTYKLNGFTETDIARLPLSGGTISYARNNKGTLTGICFSSGDRERVDISFDWDSHQATVATENRALETSIAHILQGGETPKEELYQALSDPVRALKGRHHSTLTAEEMRSILIYWLWSNRFFDEDGKVKPLGEWRGGRRVE